MSKKIGIILENHKCNYYIYSLAERLSSNSGVELYILIDNDRNFFQPINKTIQKQPIGFKIIKKAEKLYFRNKTNQFIDYFNTFDIKNIKSNDLIYLEKNNFEMNFQKIDSLQLDLIINDLPFNDFNQNYNSLAKDGILSVCFNNEPDFNNLLSILFAVKDSIPSVSFEINLQRNDLNEIIFSASFPTQRTYTESVVFVLNESILYLLDILNNYIEEGNFRSFFNHSLGIKKSDRIRFSLIDSLKYIINKIIYIVTYRYKFGRFRHRWHIGYLKKNDLNNLDFSNATTIKNPKGRFLADPFVIKKSNRVICFAEDYDFQKNIGWISAIEIINEKDYKFLGPVINEDFHMSFPFLLEFNNELYMIPETYQSNSIRLYKCIDFPMKWEFQKELINDFKAVDSMVFEYNGLWWLLTNKIRKDSVDENSALYAYYADNPLSEKWNPHKLNPIVIHSEYARNGGIIKKDGQIYRIRQQHGGKGVFYGKSFSVSKIIKLTPDSFKEEMIQRVIPDFFKGISGCHTLNQNSNYTVFDFNRYESIKN